MAKKIVKMKPLSTNVRYIKARQRVTHFLLTALWHLAPHRTQNIILKRFFKPVPHPLTPLESQYLENGTSSVFRFMTKMTEPSLTWTQRYSRGRQIMFICIRPKVWDTSES